MNSRNASPQRLRDPFMSPLYPPATRDDLRPSRQLGQLDESTWYERLTLDLSPPLPQNREQNLSTVYPSSRSAQSHFARGQTSSLTQKTASFRYGSRCSPGFRTVPTTVRRHRPQPIALMMPIGAPNSHYGRGHRMKTAGPHRDSDRRRAEARREK